MGDMSALLMLPDHAPPAIVMEAHVSHMPVQVNSLVWLGVLFMLRERAEELSNAILRLE